MNYRELNSDEQKGITFSHKTFPQLSKDVYKNNGKDTPELKSGADDNAVAWYVEKFNND